jgi:ubiquinone/menaquinone biosynthesis C-methylase UbiE
MVCLKGEVRVCSDASPRSQLINWMDDLQTQKGCLRMTAPERNPDEIPPAVALHQLGVSFWLSQALYVVAKLGVADHLKDGPYTADELAKSVGAHEGALYRVMRALASVGVFTETEPKRFALTPMGAYLQTGVAGSLRAQFLTITELDWEPWRHLLHSVQTGETAFRQAHGMGLFDYLQHHPGVGNMFDEAMTGFVMENGLAVVAAYDFTPFAKIIDVGGGSGALMAAILQASPQAQGVLFDLASVIDGAKRTIEAAGLAARCACIAGDFLTSIPAGGDAYLMASILHDWDDEHSVAILQNCRRVMSAPAKLLLVEMVIPPGDVPFYGKLLDLEMLVLTGGRERSEEEYRDLLTAAGFRLTRILSTHTASSIIEATPVE